MKWITRSHVHVDRVACPWLITRFIDNEAEFLFVPKSQLDQIAKETGAIPFDSPGVELGHHEGRCSFESIILKYDLKDAGLSDEEILRANLIASYFNFSNRIALGLGVDLEQGEQRAYKY